MLRYLIIDNIWVENYVLMNYINAREHNCHLSRPVCSGLPFGLAHSGPSLWLEAPARDGQTFIYIALIFRNLHSIHWCT